MRRRWRLPQRVGHEGGRRSSDGRWRGGGWGDARPADAGGGPRVGSGGRGKGLGTNPEDRLTAPVARVATAPAAAPPGRPLRARGQASPGRGHGSPAGMTNHDGGGARRPHLGMHRARRSPRGGVTCRRVRSDARPSAAPIGSAAAALPARPPGLTVHTHYGWI